MLSPSSSLTAEEDLDFLAPGFGLPHSCPIIFFSSLALALLCLWLQVVGRALAGGPGLAEVEEVEEVLRGLSSGSEGGWGSSSRDLGRTGWADWGG